MGSYFFLMKKLNEKKLNLPPFIYTIETVQNDKKVIKRVNLNFFYVLINFPRFTLHSFTLKSQK